MPVGIGTIEMNVPLPRMNVRQMSNNTDKQMMVVPWVHVNLN